MSHYIAHVIITISKEELNQMRPSQFGLHGCTCSVCVGIVALSSFANPLNMCERV
eukprot:c37884_g1_i1 orf=206-370(-)